MFYDKLKPYKKVIIEGHTDSRGDNSYNLNLSQRRAVQVKNWLIKKYGVDGKLFTPVGKGETVPVSTDHYSREWPVWRGREGNP